MIKKIPPGKFFGLLMVFTVLWGLVIVATDFDRLFFVYFLVVGTLILMRPKIIYQFFVNQSSNARDDEDPLEAVFAIIGVLGGIILLSVGIVGLYISRNW